MFVWIGVFSCHGYILRSGISGLYVNSVFNSFEELGKSFFTIDFTIHVHAVYESSNNI